MATPQLRHRSIKSTTMARKNRYMLIAGCEVPKDVTDEIFAAFYDSVLINNN